MINRFIDEYEFLSNFYPSPIYDDTGKEYPTVEHYFQAMKTFNPQKRELIRLAESPGKAKRIGRLVQLREDWENRKLDIMEKALIQKFQIPKLREKLLATGNEELIEGNFWNDTYWGICKGEGENHLGKLLMNIREKIRDGEL